MYLLLIRHGETDWNIQGRIQGRTDVPLNEMGLEQAGLLALRLGSEEKLDALYSSTLQRAGKTAEIIGRTLNLTPVPDDRLIERAVGDIEGLTIDEVKESYPEVFRAWREERWQLLVPGAEDQPSLFKRVTSFLEMLKAKHEGNRFGVVTHGGTMGMVLAAVLDLDIHKRFPFRFDNASISRVDFTPGRPRIEALNDTCHLHIAEYSRALGANDQAANALETD